MAGKKFKKYLKIWWISTIRVTQIALTSRVGAVMFILGKILRFAFFLMFLLILASRTNAIADYSIYQIIFIFATFNIVDTTSQLLFREVYRFRYYVVSGELDYFLTKPISVLWRCLFGGSDILDVPILLISLFFIAYSAIQLPNISPVSVILYVLLLANALIIALALHIMVLALGVLTTEIDHTIMIYRDLTQMARLPVDIYREPLRFIITFVIPVGVMMTVPAKSFFGVLPPMLFVFALAISVILLIVSLRFWRFALKNYSSVSS